VKERQSRHACLEKVPVLADKSHSPMPKSTINFDSVRKIGLALPGVEESTAYGSPAWKIHGKLLACLPAHRSAEPGSLVVRVDFDDRAELLAAAPDVYYVTDHYLNYSSVLVRLSRVRPSVLRDLLGMAHKFVIAEAARPSPSRHCRKPV
jgi:hypothetical protein